MAKIQLIENIPGYYEFDRFFMEKTLHATLIIYSFYSNKSYNIDFKYILEIKILNNWNDLYEMEDSGEETNPILDFSFNKENDIYDCNVETSNQIFIVKCNELNILEN